MGAVGVEQAVRGAAAFADQDIARFEEPVSSDDLPGLREVRGSVNDTAEQVVAAVFDQTQARYRDTLIPAA